MMCSDLQRCIESSQFEKYKNTFHRTLFRDIVRFVSAKFLKFIEKHGVVCARSDPTTFAEGAKMECLGEKETRLTASVCNEHLWAASTDA